MSSVRLYHRTTSETATVILAAGFRDSTGSYGFTSIALTGVFVSDRPLDENEGASGDTVLALDGLDPRALVDFELVQEESEYREWCVPALLLNTGRVTVLTESELDRLEDSRWGFEPDSVANPVANGRLTD